MAMEERGHGVNQRNISDQNDSSTERTRGKNKGFDCEVCFVTYSTKRNLRRHVSRYKDPKFPCNQCGIKFCNPELLQSHFTFAHDIAVLNNYKLRCPVCNQASNMETYLRSHICHYHTEWVHKNLQIFASKSYRNKTKNSSTIENRESTPMTKRARKLQIIRFIKSLSRATSNEGKRNSSNDLQNREDFKTLWFRNTRSANNNYHISLPDRSELGWNEVNEASNDLRKKSFANVNSNDAYRNIASLRSLYSLKDCYVPLTRIDSRITYSVDSESCKMNESLEQLQGKRLRNQEIEESKKLKLMDVEVHLDKISKSEIIFESSADAYDLPDAFPEPLDDCFDPLGFYTSDENNSDADESTMKMTDTYEQYPMSFEYPIKTEAVSIENTTSLETNTEICGQKQESLNLADKPEPMDCDADGDSTIRDGSLAAGSEFMNVPAKTETVYFDINQPSGDVTNESMEYMETFDPLFNVEVQNQINSEYTDCTTESASEGIPDTSMPQFETRILSSIPEETQVDQGRTMIVSKLCNKLFSGRRAMLRHCRDVHLTCFNDTIYCYCGKEMIGRRAMEHHFSLHCDSVIKTTREASNPTSPCKPLEKKYKCAKCGEKFWLETCLKDHPPNCEIPKLQGNQTRIAKNLDKALAISNHFGKNKEYSCRVCDAKFTCTGNLMRHIRLFSSNEKYACPTCLTVFNGIRLLKGHIQSTHERNPSTLYTYFCGICNQGFTRKCYQRMHMMHIHPNEATKSAEVTTERTRPTATTSVPLSSNTPDNQCDVCNLVFINKKRFMDHISYYNSNELFRCNICGKTFEGQYKAHHHRKKDHYVRNVQNAYSHYCVICKEGFMYKTHLHAHMFHVHDKQFNCVKSVKTNTRLEGNAVLPVEEFACAHCPKKFNAVSLLVFHNNSCHRGPKPGTVKCNQCNEEFSTWSDWVVHLNNSHANLSNDPLGFHIATEDSKSTASTDNVNAASNGKFSCITDPNAEQPQPPGANQRNPPKSTSQNIFHGRENIKTVQEVKTSTRCNICGVDCPAPWELSRHKATYSNSGIYVCEFCGRRFSWQSSYRDHKLKHFRRDVHNHCFCPICDEGFESVECLNMHKIHLHDEPFDISQVYVSSHDLTCDICNMVFVSKEKLRGHRENYHLLPVLTKAPDGYTNRQSNANGDRFYVMAGDNIHPQAVYSIGKRVYECNKSIGLTRNLYRYDAPLTCKVCNLTFASKDMLTDHHEMLHTIRRNFQFVSVSAGENQTTNAVTVSNLVSPNQMEPATITLLETGTQEPDIVNEISTKTGSSSETSIIKINKTTNDKQVNHYKCSVCNIVFIDKNLLAVHEENVHCLTTLDCDSSNEEFPQSQNTSTKNCQPLIIDIDRETEGKSPPTKQLVPDRTQSASNLGPVPGPTDPEEILISDDETDKCKLLTRNNPSINNVNTTDASPQRVRFVNLPPGNYTISKLKVRSNDMIVKKVMRNINCAERSSTAKKP